MTTEKLFNLNNDLKEEGSDLPSIFLMRYFSGLSIEEIAEKLFCSPLEIETKIKTIEAIIERKIK